MKNFVQRKRVIKTSDKNKRVIKTINHGEEILRNQCT